MQAPTGTVTFLFTDIEGSTRLARRHADIWETLRSRHHEILGAAIEQNNGFVFQIIGDAFCTAFSTAGDALKAAVQAQQSLQSEPWGETPVRVRMGIHTGAAEFNGQDYRGYLTMSMVQRLMLTFKENCPDVRNSKVVDIVRAAARDQCAVVIREAAVGKFRRRKLGKKPVSVGPPLFEFSRPQRHAATNHLFQETTR